MKFKKLAACAMLMLSAVGLLAGCGGQSKENKTIKIGFLAPLTGGNSALGVGMKNSAQLAIDKANKSGKYPYKFELVALDDGGDPSTAVAAANKLVADKDIIAAGGHFNSGCALATVPIFHKNGLPFVVTAAIHPDITSKGYKEITRIMTASDMQTKFAGELAATKWGAKTIALINDRTDYGKTNATSFGKAATEHGAKVISDDGVNVGQQDFSAVLTKIKAEKPDCIYFGGVATEAGLLKKQMADLQMDCLFISDTGIVSDTFNKIAGAAAEGTIAFNIGKPLMELAGGKEFAADYKAAGFTEPYENWGHFAYETVNLIMQAISDNKATTRAKAAEAIRNIHFKGLLGETVFDDHGQTKNNLIVPYVSHNGKWMLLETSGVKIENAKVSK
ncbi:MAG: branched-chain amino acid ABC transporter substrate-binding protein [Succiniclasticum sp.]